MKDDMIRRFQTTYEELKHMAEALANILEVRFQTTYEELKPAP